MLTFGLLVALLIWPSWHRLWAFAALIALVSAISVLVFASLAQSTSNDFDVSAALFSYLVFYQGIFRKSVNLAAFVAIGAMIVWLRLGAKLPKIRLAEVPKVLVGPFRLWVVCAAVVVSFGAWNSVSNAPYLPRLIVEADTSQCRGAQFPDWYYEKQLSKAGLPSEFLQRGAARGSDFLHAPKDQYDFPHIPQLGLPADPAKLQDVLEAQRRDKVYESTRDEIIERLDAVAEESCQLRIKREFDPAVARSEYRAALWSYWKDRGTEIAPYLLAPFFIPAALWSLWLVIRWVIRGFVHGRD